MTLCPPINGSIPQINGSARCSLSVESPPAQKLRIPLIKGIATVGARHRDPWLSHCQNYPIGLKRKLVPRLPGKTQMIGLPCEQSPKSFCRLTAVARNERSAVERKIPLPSQRGAKPDQERNEINGRGPPSAGRMPFMSDSTLSRRSAAL